MAGREFEVVFDVHAGRVAFMAVSTATATMLLAIAVAV
jgi:hypothetical protein